MARALDRPWTKLSSAEEAVAGREPGDRRLVECAQRERAAFAPLYDRYLTAIYRYCYLRLG